MDAPNALAAILGSTALAAVTVLRTSLRILTGWIVNITSRQAGLLTILSQSITLFLLSLAVAYLRKPETRR